MDVRHEPTDQERRDPRLSDSANVALGTLLGVGNVGDIPFTPCVRSRKRLVPHIDDFRKER